MVFCSPNSLNWEEHYNLIISKSYRQLSLLRRTITIPNAHARKNLYLSLVRLQLTFCSPVWRPSLIKHFEPLERVQCQATKFILSNYMLDYKSRLVQLNFFPLMYWYERFLVKFLKNPETRLNISEYVVFSSTKKRSASYFKLTCHCSRTNLSRHFYFNRI